MIFKLSAVFQQTANQKLRIGILPFDVKTGGANALAQALQGSLKNRLFLTKRFDVVEDDDMTKVLNELKIQEQGDGILRQDTIHRMGELLGADAIVSSTITQVGNDYLIDCRLIPISSGVVGSAGETKIAKETTYYWPANTSYNSSTTPSYQSGGVNYQYNQPTYYTPSYNVSKPGYNYNYGGK